MNIQNGPMKAILTSAAAAVFLLSACGSDGSTAVEATEDVSAADDTVPTEVPEAVEEDASAEEDAPAEEVVVPPELEVAVAGMTVAWGNGDGDQAWTFDSGRCRLNNVDAPEGYVNNVVGWGRQHAGANASNITAVIDGDRAAVTYDVYDGSEGFVGEWVAQPWVLTDGDWFRDAC